MNDIKHAIRKLAQTNDEIYSIIGTVIDIDESKRTCDVKPVNGDAIIYDVRLQALISSANSVTLFPKKDSFVIVSFLGKEDAFVSMYGEVDHIKSKIGDQTMDYDEKGLKLKSKTADFTDTFNDIISVIDKLISILIQFKLATPSGPTITVMPELIAKLNTQKTNLKKAKKDLNTIIK